MEKGYCTHSEVCDDPKRGKQEKQEKRDQSPPIAPVTWQGDMVHDVMMSVGDGGMHTRQKLQGL